MFQAKPYILVPLDLSAAALAVLPLARTLAAALDCDITLLHVVAPAAALMQIGDGAVVEPRLARECERAWIDSARAALAGYAEHIGVEVDVRVKIAVDHCVADAIVTAARAEPPLFIAMVCRGCRFQRAAGDTTAGVVLRSAGAPVLLHAA